MHFLATRGSISGGDLADTARDGVAKTYSTAMTSDRLTVIVVGAFFTAIGLTTMILRLLSGIIRRRQPGKDDYAMWLAWLSSIGFTTASYISVRWGVGYSDAPPDRKVEAVKAIYAIELFYYFSLFFIKMSIMFLYLRLAAELDGLFYKGTVITAAVIIAHFISTVVIVGVQCIPMEKYWLPSTPGHCINITAFFYSTNVFTIITDIVILTLPIRTLWKVQCPRGQRIAIMSAFLVGGLSTIASIIRLYSVRIYTESSHPIRDAAPINTWSFIEVNLGILCASAPAIKPLFMPPKNSQSSSSYDSGNSGHSRRKRSPVEAVELTELPASTDDIQSDRVTKTPTVTHVSPASEFSEDVPTLRKDRSGRAANARFRSRGTDSPSLRPDPADYRVWAEPLAHDQNSIRSFDSQQIMIKKSVTVDGQLAAGS